MRTKNRTIIGGILALTTCGISLASATMLAPEDTYIRVKPTANSVFMCVKCGGQCDNNGTQLCEVRVNTTSSGWITVPGRRGPNCTPILKHTTAVVHTCPTLFYAAE